MIDKLPLEIQEKFLLLCPYSSLKHVNSHFYILYNELYFGKIVNTCGTDIVKVIIKVLPWLKTYVKTLDAFRYKTRNIISSRLNLRDINSATEEDRGNESLLDSLYVRDSWKYIYSVIRNRRIFSEYKDYKINEPTNYIFNNFVEVNKSYLLSYNKEVWLAPGAYNLNIGLVVRDGCGLGTTKFEVKHSDSANQAIIQTFYPPSNIKDIIPKKQFCLLKLGEFVIHEHGESRLNKLVRVRIVMEEIGLYLKSGFRIFFIDISSPSVLFNDYDLMYYTVNLSDYRYFINMPLKNLYKALDYVQCGNGSEHRHYGENDPNEIQDEYNYMYLNDYSQCPCILGGNQHSSMGISEPDVPLMSYSNFYFNNQFCKRLFKFNTVYQKRLFIHKYGNFETDWHHHDENDNSQNYEEGRNLRYCNYDSKGLKWKIPIVCEL